MVAIMRMSVKELREKYERDKKKNTRRQRDFSQNKVAAGENREGFWIDKESKEKLEIIKKGFLMENGSIKITKQELYQKLISEFLKLKEERSRVSKYASELLKEFKELKRRNKALKARIKEIEG